MIESLLNLPRTFNYTPLNERVKALMDEKQLRASDLARMTNMPEATLRYILRGHTKRTSPNYVKKVADFFNVSIDYLIDGEVSTEGPKKEIPEAQEKLFLIPISQAIDVKPFIANRSAIPYPDDQDWVPVSDYVSKEAFCVRVDYKDKDAFAGGSVLIVDPKKSWDVGRLRFSIY